MMRNLKFRVKLTLIFIGFLLIPIIPLGFITLNLLTRNIDFWSNQRVEKSLEDAFSISQRMKNEQKELDSETIKRLDNIAGSLQVFKQLQLIKKPLKTMFWVLFSIGVFALVFTGVIIAKRISKKIETPVRNLLQGTDRITHGGFGYQIPAGDKDEFGDLIKSFNKMSKELETQREALKSAERLKAWQQIARIVSHEIKNSLTPIGISIDRMKMTSVESSTSRFIGTQNFEECLSTIKEEVNNLKRLAGEFSEFARLPELKLEKCNLNEVVDGIVGAQNFEPLLKRKIRTNYFGDIPEVLIDKDGMRRVFTNLIKNSIEAGGEITISTSIDKEWVLIKVTDTGTGIPRDMLPKVFEPYVSTKSKGAGLGLAIAKKIVIDHGGKIDIESEEGKGTVVVVRLPLSRGSKF